MKTTDFKGTKGEWRMMVGGFTTKGNIPNMIQIYATNEDLEMVCKVYKDGLLHAREQYFEANAKLIVASPKLLEALEHTLELLYECEPPKHLIETYANAIANYKNLIDETLT